MGDIRLSLRIAGESLAAFRTAITDTLEVLKEGFTAEAPTSSIETLDQEALQRLRVRAGEGTILAASEHLETYTRLIRIATPKYLAAGIRLIRPSFEVVPIDLTYDEFTILRSTVEYLWPDFPGARIITIATERVLIPEFVPTAAGTGFRVHQVMPRLWVVPRKVKAAYHPAPKHLVLRLVA